MPALRQKVRVNVGKRYEGDIGMSGRVLLLLAPRRAGRARPAARDVDQQPVPLGADGRAGSGARCPSCRRPRPRPRSSGAGWRASVPGTEADLRWWTGWTARAVRAALATVGAVEVDLDGQAGFVLPDDLEPTPAPEPWVALLPSLDPTTMGWQARDWYLGGHQDALFDTNGNAGPTIWVDGRIVGGWAMRADGEVVTRLLEDVGREAARAVEAEAARLTEWLQAAAGGPSLPVAAPQGAHPVTAAGGPSRARSARGALP